MAELQSWERLRYGDTGDVILAADRWDTEIHTTEPRVRALLGFCAGSMSDAARLESVSRGEDTPAHLIGTATTACQPGQCCEQGDS